MCVCVRACVRACVCARVVVVACGAEYHPPPPPVSRLTPTPTPMPSSKMSFLTPRLFVVRLARARSSVHFSQSVNVSFPVCLVSCTTRTALHIITYGNFLCLKLSIHFTHLRSFWGNCTSSIMMIEQQFFGNFMVALRVERT